MKGVCVHVCACILADTCSSILQQVPFSSQNLYLKFELNSLDALFLPFIHHDHVGNLTINRNNGIDMNPTTINVTPDVQSHQNTRHNASIQQDGGVQAPLSNLDCPPLDATVRSCSYVDPNSILTYEDIDSFRSGWLLPDYEHPTRQNLWIQALRDMEESGQSDTRARLSTSLDSIDMSAESYLIPHSTLWRSSSSISIESTTSLNQGGFTAKYLNFPSLTESRYSSNGSGPARPTPETFTETGQSVSVKKSDENGDVPSASPVDTKPSRLLKQVYSLPEISQSPTSRKSRRTTRVQRLRSRRLQDFQEADSSIQHSGTPNGHLYQDLKHTTMEYCSLYHTVNKSTAHKA